MIETVIVLAFALRLGGDRAGSLTGIRSKGYVPQSTLPFYIAITTQDKPSGITRKHCRLGRVQPGECETSGLADALAREKSGNEVGLEVVPN